MSAAGQHPEPINIQRLVRENARIAQAKVYADSIQKGSTAAAWRQQAALETACGARFDRAVQAQEARLTLRKQKLRQLLAQEQKMFDAELQARRLCLAKHTL